MDNDIVAKTAADNILVEVAYATAKSQLIYAIDINKHSTIEEAIIASGVLNDFPEIDLTVNKVGIFSKLAKLNQQLRHKDRIEIYRKLIADPKAIRKQRALEGKKMKKGN
ncbi:MAG: RnfH family protein [Thiotrichaceae bacterium]|nr:RnfH family protein [Thiotrichaceae bacterium]